MSKKKLHNVSRHKLIFFNTDLKSEKNDITSGRPYVIFKSQNYFRNKEEMT
jgi:hypothetical protein